MEIKEAKGGKLQGTIQNLQRSACAIGTGDARGTYEDDIVKVTEITGPDRPQRSGLIRFEGTIVGDKIVGKTRYNREPYDLTLTPSK